ncbi:uncharacterized protein OCT59_023906 [Rhizophagus irregularis]|uniref:Cdc15p n=2 Tax=Rhizophagus irregularis TaxID=588596 RepID=A0A015J4Y6_RHIIW|nr:kinase-like domain-containing protein [Rhizophagus irregularis DAOM 181602=DAOM 197198]EXX61790.1 Cdc15p [Rhizophagus irregularis DAOM 197198w]POG68384.1 kinase-like domain-containing protein [Rhizophagus irregularis DAOM 181602=DAOM 197198]UZO03499.1 hypothetical protein OCT59_023906 [Rhizophagus irregularis]GBC21989.1 kinase-like domain-containing protein [Rhizophagus irregularis DAOM 181602=DAOM 197198]|eukprot:XP_025175250.1 kinase-like domain-containing protein [Rhizophagus irregularis DAOM 181602=DAOM 197198]
MQNNEKTNEWINWIEDAINKKHIKYYEFEYFSNIQEIGSGAFGKVFRANWKNFEQYLALKSFLNLNDATLKETVKELTLQRGVDFHGNIIRFYGITKFGSSIENIFNPTKGYLLVMEYADSGTLRDYLNKNFNKLTWNDKYKLAYQLACAISCLHDEKIVHRDLHSCNVLVHQNSIKLADFGLSKWIEEASNSQTKLFGRVPYIDPKVLMDDNLNLNEKSDIYSIGVLLWEISSGYPPFHGKSYNFSLMYKISQGQREEIISNTPSDYSNLYTECWNGEPNKRPSIKEVVSRLKGFISCSNGVNIYQQNEKNLNMIIDEIINRIFNGLNKGNVTKEYVLMIINIYNTNLYEIYNWLLNNQINPNSIFFLGYFNYYGIEITEDEEKAFSLFIDASEKGHILAQYFVGECHEFGNGTTINNKLAFEYYKKLADKDFAIGQFKLGWFYKNGLSVSTDFSMAADWYEKAAINGHLIAMCNLGNSYRNGDGVEENHQRAFELYKKSAEGIYSGGIMMLGYCYHNGIGINIHIQKAVELYRKAASLENKIAQYNLALMHEKGEGIGKDIDKAIYWYEQSAKQGYQDAQNRFNVLTKIRNNLCQSYAFFNIPERVESGRV